MWTDEQKLSREKNRKPFIDNSRKREEEEPFRIGSPADRKQPQSILTFLAMGAKMMSGAASYSDDGDDKRSQESVDLVSEDGNEWVKILH